VAAYRGGERDHEDALNAAVHELPKPTAAWADGAYPLKGKKLPNLAEIAKTAVFRQSRSPARTGVPVRAHPRVRVPLVCAVLHPSGQGDPDPHANSNKDFDIALASTDPDAPPPC